MTFALNKVQLTAEETENTQSENKSNNLLYLLCEPLAFSAVNLVLNRIVFKNEKSLIEIIDSFKYYYSSELFNVLLNQLLTSFFPVSRSVGG